MHDETDVEDIPYLHIRHDTRPLTSGARIYGRPHGVNVCSYFYDIPLPRSRQHLGVFAAEEIAT
jgi:hypothetical protein